jgi:flagellar motor protein MotB
MRKFLFVTLFLAGLTTLKCQQINLEAGNTISSFNYKNSQGTSLENLQATNHSFMNLGYRMNIFTKNLFLDLDGNYNGYGAVGSDRILDNYFEWNVYYAGVRAGLDYEVFKPGNFTFFIKGSASAEFLIHGTQTLNNQIYKLRGDEEFKSPLYFFRAGLGIQYDVSEKLTLFTQYMYGKSGSFKNVQGKLNINAHSIGFGLLVNISKKQQPAAAVGSVQMNELKKELEVNSQKVKELEASARQVDVLEEQVIAKEEEIVAKEKEIRSLKESISNALLAFEGKGLTIIEREGKVYVTMETDMLFQSGSWNIGAEGEKAVNALGNVLADNPDVTVLIEGHTDNEPFKGSGNINNNWDLSTKRATAIVEILRNNKKINPKNLTAAGRGEYDPIADNATIEGKAKNRRIEVIITPKLDEVFKLIKK